jgi:glycosyltransferase involved in cell wall biosynthesis
MLISIVTPCLNRVGFVAEAIESVRHQDHPDVEHIVVDGGSTDGTLDLLARYPGVSVSSEPDGGIYDGLNKGIARANGDVIGFLNTDDVYEPDVFAAVAETFDDRPEVDAVVGGATIYRQPSSGERLTLMSFAAVAPGELLQRATCGAPIFNAWFFRRHLFGRLGNFDTRYLYVADRDFLIRMALQACQYANLDRSVYHYRMHPGSVTLSGHESGEDDWMFECRAVAERYLVVSPTPAAVATFRAWHSQLTIQQLFSAMHKRALWRGCRYAWIGLKHNRVGWVKAFAEELLQRASVALNLAASGAA